MDTSIGGTYHCCVPKCTNDSRYDPERKISFHKFPKDASISDATRVCSSHFLTTEIQKTLTGKRKLTQGAVPSLFAWSISATPKRPGPRRRLVENFDDNIAKAPKLSCTSTSPDAENQILGEKIVTPFVSNDHDYVVQTLSTEEKLQAALKEVELLQNQVTTLSSNTFCLNRFSTDNSLINFYTGFINYETLKSVFTALQPTATTMVRWSQMQRHVNKENVNENAFHCETLLLIDQFFLFLCRVRQGLSEQDLAVRFNISQSSVSRILITWANYLYCMLGSLPLWSSRAAIDESMPQSFKDTYPKTRVILDCTEIRVQTPSSKVLNSETYSSYKSHTTFKSLVGITPNGAISFVSSLYTGSISDKAITEKSGILDLLEPGDEVMADKGFLINDLLKTKQASLVIPPFLGQKGKFSKDEVEKTHEIARLRIHVERAIRRIKEYHLFDKVIPLNMASSINQIWTVCAILTNFRGPLF
ncbi:unnamed protein product [Mytilus edulis]|uniref:THAP-type domain-containing protein n=1 Tax=Mytilus edulis TaxID=6550 RepID=A0A8S3RQ55_MYTED|nr:unnamed protein product [Mytilus edulis]